MHNTFAVCPAPAHFRHGLTVRASVRHAPSPLENAVPPTLQTVSLRPPRPPVHAHTQPRKRGHRALVEMMGLRLAPLDQVASMRHLEEHEQLRDGALQHLPHQRSGREGRRKWQRHGPTGLCILQVASSVEQGIWVHLFYPLTVLCIHILNRIPIRLATSRLRCTRQ